MFRVLVVDDDKKIAFGVAGSLEQEPDMEIVGIAHDGRAAIAKARETRPDVVLMDLGMAGMGGIAATSHIRAEMSDVEVIVVTSFDDDDHLFGAFKAGATGYVVKGAPPEEIAQCIRDRRRQIVFLPPSLSIRVISEFNRIGNTAGRKTTGFREITPQELEVLTLIAAGKTNKQIAEALYIEPVTVRNHVTSILHKLAANNRMEAAQIGRDRGLIHT